MITKASINENLLNISFIFRHYFIKSQLTIREELRREVTQRIKDREHLGPNSSTIFNDVQTEVEKLINDTTYPEFLQSDLYLEYIQVSNLIFYIYLLKIYGSKSNLQ